MHEFEGYEETSATVTRETKKQDENLERVLETQEKTVSLAMKCK